MNKARVLLLPLLLLGCQGEPPQDGKASDTRHGEATGASYGGPVLTQAHVRVILWGDEFAAANYQLITTAVTNNIRDLVNRPEFYAPLAEYSGSNGSVQPGRLDFVRIVPHTFPDTFVNHTGCGGGSNPCALPQDYAAMLKQTAAGDVVDSNSIYMIVTPPEVALGVVAQNWQSGAIEAGFHDAMLLADGKTVIRFGIATGDGTDVFGRSGLVHFSHELSEAITDPYPDDQSMGFLPANPEIGDPCIAQPDTSLDGIGVQTEWSVAQGKCVGYTAWPEFVGGNVIGDDGLDNQNINTTRFTELPGNGSFVVVGNQYTTSNPSVGQPAMFAINSSNGVEYKLYNGTGDWTAWTQLPSPGWVSKIAVASSPQRPGYDVVGIGGDGNVWWRVAGNGFVDAWGGWSQIGTFPTADVAAVYGNGGVAIYALGTDGQVRYQLVTGTANATNSWTVLGGLPGPATAFAVQALSPGGSVNVVAMVGSGFEPYISRVRVAHIYTAWDFWQQPFANAGATYPWTVAAYDYKSLALGLTAAGSPGGARLAIAVSTSNNVWLGIDNGSDTTKLGQSWQQLGFLPQIGPMALANLSDGRMALFGLDGERHIDVQAQDGLGDGDWFLATSLGGWFATVQAFTWPNGLIEVYGLDELTHRVAHDWQQQAGYPGNWIF